MRVNFIGNYLKQSNKIRYDKIVNIYIFYEIKASSSNDNDHTLKIGLFGRVTLTKNADIDKYSILVMELDLIEDQAIHFQVVDMVKMY